MACGPLQRMPKQSSGEHFLGHNVPTMVTAASSRRAMHGKCTQTVIETIRETIRCSVRNKSAKKSKASQKHIEHQGLGMDIKRSHGRIALVVFHPFDDRRSCLFLSLFALASVVPSRTREMPKSPSFMAEPSGESKSNTTLKSKHELLTQVTRLAAFRPAFGKEDVGGFQVPVQNFL